MPAAFLAADMKTKAELPSLQPLLVSSCQMHHSDLFHQTMLEGSSPLGPFWFFSSFPWIFYLCAILAGAVSDKRADCYYSRMNFTALHAEACCLFLHDIPYNENDVLQRITKKWELIVYLQGDTKVIVLLEIRLSTTAELCERFSSSSRCKLRV